MLLRGQQDCHPSFLLQSPAGGWRPSWISVRLFLPFIIGLDKSIMDRLLCLHPLFHSLLVTFERANVKPFSLKAYIYPVFSGLLSLKTPLKPLGIVLPAFALLQYFHTGAVYPVELLSYSFLIFALQTAAAPDASLYKAILCDGVSAPRRRRGTSSRQNPSGPSPQEAVWLSAARTFCLSDLLGCGSGPWSGSRSF